MIEEIIRVTKGNILVMLLLGAIGIVATPVALGASWVAYECQKTIITNQADGIEPIAVNIQLRNNFFMMSILFGPMSYFSTYFLYKMLTSK